MGLERQPKQQSAAATSLGSTRCRTGKTRTILSDKGEARKNSSPLCGTTFLTRSFERPRGFRGSRAQPESQACSRRTRPPGTRDKAGSSRAILYQPHHALNADESYMDSYIQTDSQVYCGVGKSRGHPGCNPGGKVPAAKLGFRLAIPPRPCRIGSSAGHLTPPADPSLPTTERGISGRGWQKTDIKNGRGGASFDNPISMVVQTQ